MEEFGPETFGALYATDYDERQDPGTTDESVELLAQLIGDGRTLELAIGSGRVAVPLATRGIDIHGIDASQEMLDVMYAKPGSQAITSNISNFADVNIVSEVEAQFDFVYLVFNTIVNLTSQDEQVRCFENVAKHLNPGGAFLVETFVPDLRQFKDHQYARTQELDFGSATLDLAKHDPVNQVIEFQRVVLSNDKVEMRPLPIRYVWPQELDLMARLAGLTLESRWGDWRRGAFTKNSGMHVSLYRKS